MSNRFAIGASIVGAAVVQYMYVRHENAEAHHSLSQDATDVNSVDVSKLSPAKRVETFGQCISKRVLRGPTGSGDWRSNLQSVSPGCGEDSFYYSDDRSVFAVADGVGGWARQGVNPKEFSQSLMTELGKQVDAVPKTAEPIDIVAALDKSHAASRRVVSAGSSTACAASLDGRHGTLKTLNVGDSGLIVFRGPNAVPVFIAEETSHGFNFPKQLGVNRGKRHGDTVFDGSQQETKVYAGDIAVTASDGVLDNLHVKDMADIVRQSKGDTRKAARDLVIAAGESALGLRSSAHVKGQWGEGDGVGGKPDDITVLVSKFSA